MTTDNTATKSWAVERRLPDGQVFRLGTVVLRGDCLGFGYRFIPAVSSRKPSRKVHATFEKCLPRWVGYPDNCETRKL